ncbi:MAG: hypothetical protein Q9170_007009 [Blastenia crenularia]
MVGSVGKGPDETGLLVGTVTAVKARGEVGLASGADGIEEGRKVPAVEELVADGIEPESCVSIEEALVHSLLEIQSTWLGRFRGYIISVRCTEKASQNSTDSLQEQILEACSGTDTSKLKSLLENWHQVLLKPAARSGSIGIVQEPIDQYGITKALDQLMLQEAARRGNVEVFRFLLQQRPDAEINDDVRSYALEGGLEIWKAILDHSPKLINYDFSEKGDLISMTVLMNNVPLLSFFLANGLDPNESRFFGKPVIDVATTNPAIKPGVLDLLLEYGATREKSLTASETPSVAECVSKIKSFGALDSKICVFYTALGGARGLTICKQYFNCNPQLGAVVLFDQVTDNGWFGAQAQAIVQGNPNANPNTAVDPFQKRMSQAFAEASKGAAYLCAEESNSPNNDFDPIRTWGGWEYPALTRNGAVTKVIRVDPSTGVSSQIWTQGDPPTPNEPRG